MINVRMLIGFGSDATGTRFGNVVLPIRYCVCEEREKLSAVWNCDSFEYSC